MKFIDYLYDTDGCLCDRLYNYDDIQLQAVYTAPTNGQAKMTFIIEAFTLEGAFIADVSSDFKKSIYFVGGTFTAYSNIVSMRIPDALCQYKCFRLRVTIKMTYTVNGLSQTKEVFKSFTDCMSVDSCCVRIPKGGITFKTVQPESLPELSFEVDNQMNLNYTEEESTELIDFEMDKAGNLIVTGEEALINSADFKLIDGNITATYYE